MLKCERVLEARTNTDEKNQLVSFLTPASLVTMVALKTAKYESAPVIRQAARRAAKRRCLSLRGGSQCTRRS